MKITTVRIKEDLRWRLNKLKNEWKVETLDQVIRRLIEICSKIEYAQSAQNSNTTHSFLHNNSLGGANIYTASSTEVKAEGKTIAGVSQAGGSIKKEEK